MGILQRIACRFGMHPRLDVIQTFGAAQHIGCPYCRREFGIHHGERIIIPWDSELAELYQMMGHETEAASQRWRRVKP